MKEELFRKSSLESLASGDSLDEYIKIERPHTGLAIFAGLLAILSLGVWLWAL